MPQIISADEIKKTLPNYSPDKAEFFHAESSREADKQFDNAIKNNPHKRTILLSGGSASGKSEFLATQLISEKGVVLDATLSTRKHAEERIRKILKAGKIPIIYFVIPDDLKRAYAAFLGRERKFRDIHFYRTHSSSRKTLQWIATNYPDLEINIIESSYTKAQKLQFAQIKFANRQEMANYLIDKQMTQDDIILSLFS